MTISKITTFLFFILFFNCCSKKEISPVDQLPDPYTAGNVQVFACLLDGEPWIPRNGVISINAISSEYNRFGGFVISGKRRNSNQNIDDSIDLFSSFQEPGRFNFQSDYTNFETSCWEYAGRNPVEDYIQIDSINREARFLIGTFQFTGIDTICQDTVRITDGRFRARF